MKVFCIGTWKTGTSSIGSAIHQLMGGRHCGNGWADGTELYKLYFDNDLESIKDIANKYDTFDDTPWNCRGVVEKLPEWFDNARFILSIRNADNWYESWNKWNYNDISSNPVGQKGKNLSKGPFYNDGYNRVSKIVQMQAPNIDIIKISNIQNNKNSWIQWFNDVNDYMISLFSNHPQKFLIYNIDDNMGWYPICNFLEKEIPKTTFPYLNKNND